MTLSDQEIKELNLIQDWYQLIESEFKIVKPENGEFWHLCDAKQNAELPIYSWYNLKEAFSSKFPVWVIERLQELYKFRPSKVLDPFVGGGTSLLSISQLGIEVTGVEYNPFIGWVSLVKSNWSLYDELEISNAILVLNWNQPKRQQIPELSTLNNEKYFRKKDVQLLIYIIGQIDNLSITEYSKDFLKIGVVSIVEAFGNLKKDGRALRYVEKSTGSNIQTLLLDRWNKQLEEVIEIKKTWQKTSKANLLFGGATNLTNLIHKNGKVEVVGLTNAQYDLVLYSPPYLNNFDYSEIYKVELWLLGFLKNQEQWVRLRKGTLKSHPSVKFDFLDYLMRDARTKIIAENIELLTKNKKLNKNMPEVIKGYFNDIYLSLKEQYRVLKPGGFLVYNVSNSKHGSLPIATDLIIAEIAKKIGFMPLELVELHNRNGRKKGSLLRESVVFMRKG